MVKKYILGILLLCSFTACKKTDNPASPETKSGNTVVEHFGLIHVKGNRIVDKNGNTAALRGMSLFWSQWGGKFFNEGCIKWLRDDWKCTIVRAACGVESGGILSNPEAEMSKVTSVIDACIASGIYVIVDWHDHHAQDHLQESREFFKSIAQKYSDKPNIIYELYNEPLQVSWSSVIKPYAEEVIKTIRQYDPDNLIVVGNPNWSQDVDIAAKDPIKDNNVAYSFHFYTSTHKQWLRDKAAAAMNSGIALFVTEYGISEANGNGNIDYLETEKWLSFVNQYGLSTCNWSVMDKDETSAALKPGSDGQGNWKESDLSTSGKFIRDYLRESNAGIFSALAEAK
ncbi:MAG: glycoside hydrolase family 5 protein [archaeon]